MAATGYKWSSIVKAGVKVSEFEQKEHQRWYRTILSNGKEEFLLNPKMPGRICKTSQPTSRNLLDRFEVHQEDVLLFIKVSVILLQIIWQNVI